MTGGAARTRIAILLSATLVVAGCGGRSAQPAAKPAPALTPPKPGPKPGTAVVTLYFSTPQADALAPETRTVPAAEVPTGKIVVSSEGIARMAATIASEVARGPKSQLLFPTVPSTAKVLAASVEPGGIVVLDFSPNLIEDSRAGEDGSRLAVYSIVDSVGAIPGVTAVRFMVGGKPPGTFRGFVDLFEPVRPDTSLLVR